VAGPTIPVLVLLGRVWLVLGLLTIPGLVRHCRSRLAALPASARYALRLWRRGYLLFASVHIGLYGSVVLALYAAVDLVGGWLSVLLDVAAVVPVLALGTALAMLLGRVATTRFGRSLAGSASGPAGSASPGPFRRSAS
jgi:hypothetical protein